MDRVPESVKRNRRTHQEAQAQLVQQVDWEREAGSGYGDLRPVGGFVLGADSSVDVVQLKAQGTSIPRHRGCDSDRV
ncbi:hypothetical protein N7533_006201 [Penicillium manginii]|uniref:uncharacterized protein n=1 Tax=Penicillium manginii TaxID=203109 RepID=UPI00254998F8|nr:uncharacterized protein N7533_006201 [Penicillium manginii]KAJ5756658.1 hypothetical protein N7533_006201 [Penicillium manginii]